LLVGLTGSGQPEMTQIGDHAVRSVDRQNHWIGQSSLAGNRREQTPPSRHPARVRVDFTSQQRTPKGSARWYVIARNGL
jgi:hypothetical protein